MSSELMRFSVLVQDAHNNKSNKTGASASLRTLAASPLFTFGGSAQIEEGKYLMPSRPSDANSAACSLCSSSGIAAICAEGLHDPTCRAACARILAATLHWDCDCVRFIKAGGVAAIVAASNHLTASDRSEKLGDYLFLAISNLHRSDDPVVMNALAGKGLLKPPLVDAIPGLIQHTSCPLGATYMFETLEFHRK